MGKRAQGAPLSLTRKEVHTKMIADLLPVLVSRAGLISSLFPQGNEFQTSVPKKRHI